MARSDVGYTVRAAALHVWKTIVSNTPRTLAEILPTLMRAIITSLAAPGVRTAPSLGRQAHSTFLAHLESCKAHAQFSPVLLADLQSRIFLQLQCQKGDSNSLVQGIDSRVNDDIPHT